MRTTKLSDSKSSAQIVALLVTTYRVEHGSSQAELAELLGMPRASVTRLETGSHEPSLATLPRLASALHVTLDLHIAPNSVVLRSAQARTRRHPT